MKYTIQEGDTLWGLAEKFLRNAYRWGEIERFNRTALSKERKRHQGRYTKSKAEVEDHTLIYPGTIIEIPPFL